jgi:hypothetical protein
MSGACHLDLDTLSYPDDVILEAHYSRKSPTGRQNWIESWVVQRQRLGLFSSYPETKNGGKLKVPHSLAIMAG